MVSLALAVAGLSVVMMLVPWLKCRRVEDDFTKE